MDGVSLLQTPVGFTLLDSLPPYDPSTVDALSMRLRQQGYDPNLIAAALTQQRLRARAAAKFGEHAASMLFTEAGLQQATRATAVNATLSAVTSPVPSLRVRRSDCRLDKIVPIAIVIVMNPA